MTMKEVDFRINLVAPLMCVVESLGLVVTDDNQALLIISFLQVSLQVSCQFSLLLSSQS
jgi:hypothetical protein